MRSKDGWQLALPVAMVGAAVVVCTLIVATQTAAPSALSAGRGGSMKMQLRGVQRARTTMLDEECISWRGCTGRYEPDTMDLNNPDTEYPDLGQGQSFYGLLTSSRIHAHVSTAPHAHAHVPLHMCLATQSATNSVPARSTLAQMQSYYIQTDTSFVLFRSSTLFRYRFPSHLPAFSSLPLPPSLPPNLTPHRPFRQLPQRVGRVAWSQVHSRSLPRRIPRVRARGALRHCGGRHDKVLSFPGLWLIMGRRL